MVVDMRWRKENKQLFSKEVTRLYQIEYYYNCSLLLTMTFHLPRGKVVTNSTSSLQIFLTFLKGCNSGADYSLPLGERILNYTPKG